MLYRGGIIRTVGDIHPSEPDPKAGDGEKDYSHDDTPFGDPDSQEGDAD